MPRGCRYPGRLPKPQPVDVALSRFKLFCQASTPRPEDRAEARGYFTVLSDSHWTPTERERIAQELRAITAISPDSQIAHFLLHLREQFAQP